MELQKNDQAEVKLCFHLTNKVNHPRILKPFGITYAEESRGMWFLFYQDFGYYLDECKWYVNERELWMNNIRRILKTLKHMYRTGIYHGDLKNTKTIQ